MCLHLMAAVLWSLVPGLQQGQDESIGLGSCEQLAVNPSESISSKQGQLVQEQLVQFLCSTLSSISPPSNVNIMFEL